MILKIGRNRHDISMHLLYKFDDSIMNRWRVMVPRISIYKRTDFKINKTDVERRQTLGHPRSINPNMINHVPQQSPLKSYMLSVHEAIKISFSYHVPCQGSRNCQKSDVSNHSLTWFGPLSITAHPYSKSISIIKMYSTNNIDS